MDQNTYPNFNQEKTVCERFIGVIRTTSPFRTILFTTQQNRNNTAVSSDTSPNVSLMTRTPVNDRCARISQQPVAPATGDYCPRILKQPDSKNELGAVPVIFSQQDGSAHKSHKRVPLQVPSKNVSQAKSKAAATVDQGNATVLPIHGNENRLPSMSHVIEKSSFAESVDGMFAAYLDRAGRKIRSPTNVGQNPSMRGDSFNDRFSNYIDRSKHKFQTAPSSVDASLREEFRGKGNGFK